MAGFNGWDAAVLRAVGAPLTRENLRALDAWQQAEGGGASFNPLNTTQSEPGATSYNGVGVRNFRSPQQGIQATASTLLNGRYGNIISLLRSGHASAPQIATAVAQSPWGTGSGVLRVLQSGPVPIPAGSSNGRTPGSDPGNLGSTPGPAAIPGLSGQRLALTMSLLQQAAQDFGTGGGQGFDPSGILALALSRRMAGATQQVNGPTARPGTRTAAAAQGSYPVSPSGVKVIGASLQGTDPTFWSKVASAAKMAGATAVRLNSARRNEAHNASVGGVSNSNHLYGHAVDGEAFIPGRGWIPLGDLPTLGRVGLRSGDQPGFFNGHLDPVHVDDAYNQRI